MGLESLRVGGGEGGRFAATYRPVGPAAPAPPESLREWWAERYCLYTADSRGRLLRGEVDHTPWELQPAEVKVRENSLAVPLQLELANPPSDPYFARRCEVVVWLPRRT